MLSGIALWGGSLIIYNAVSVPWCAGAARYYRVTMRAGRSAAAVMFLHFFV